MRARSALDHSPWRRLTAPAAEDGCGANATGSTVTCAGAEPVTACGAMEAALDPSFRLVAWAGINGGCGAVAIGASPPGSDDGAAAG